MKKCFANSDRIQILRDHSKDEVFIAKVAECFPKIDTSRELEVLFYLLNFFGNKEIGKMLFITEETVKFRNTSIFKKSGVKNRRGILAKFYQTAESLRRAPTLEPEICPACKAKHIPILPFSRPISAENHT